MVPPQQNDVTQLLVAVNNGDREALDQLLPLVYNELHRLADHYLRRERSDHTLQATALVHEAYLRLVDQNVSWKNRAHFFGVAAEMMRRILVDHARSHQAAKRGSGGKPIKTFEIPPTVYIDTELRWTPDGRAITYLDHCGGQANLWIQPLDGGPPKQLTDFKTDQIFSFDWSRDGRLVYSRGLRTNDVVLIKDAGK